MYGPNTVYIIGDAKSQQNNPIQQTFGRFMLGLVVDRDTGNILNCGSSVMMKSTYDFIDSLFSGRNLLSDGDAIKRDVRTVISARRRRRSFSPSKTPSADSVFISRGSGARSSPGSRTTRADGGLTGEGFFGNL